MINSIWFHCGPETPDLPPHNLFAFPRWQQQFATDRRYTPLSGGWQSPSAPSGLAACLPISLQSSGTTLVPELNF